MSLWLIAVVQKIHFPAFSLDSRNSSRQNARVFRLVETLTERNRTDNF
jgi:hypothetical protein